LEKTDRGHKSFVGIFRGRKFHTTFSNFVPSSLKVKQRSFQCPGIKLHSLEPILRSRVTTAALLKLFSTTSNLVPFETRIFSTMYFVKRSLQQRLHCSCKLRIRRNGSWFVFKKNFTVFRLMEYFALLRNIVDYVIKM
jgi:hypothetical protein